MSSAHALTVNVEGFGEIPTEGLEITVSEVQEDILTGDPVMEVNGTLLANGSLSVQISRSNTGLTDQFCCGQCMNGNGEQTQSLNFSPSGVVKWYAHYTPTENSYETITYTFTEGTESLPLTVHYNNGGIPPFTIPATFPKKNLIEEFTGQGCGYCPSGMDAVSEFIGDESNWVLVLHHAGYSDDHFTVTGSKTISNKLGVNGAPSSCINRAKTTYKENNASKSEIFFHPGYLPTVNKSQFETTTYASVNIRNTYNSETRELKVAIDGVIGKEEIPANLVLTVLVKESGMIDTQADFYATYEGWQEFRHANAVRVFLTSATGNALNLDSATHVYSAEYTTTLNSKWVADNCMVVAFLSESLKPVVQAEERPVVSGTQGGADIEHGGITPVPVADYYPEPSATDGPAAYTKQVTELLPNTYKSYQAYPTYGFNFWTIQAYNAHETVTINRYICIPFAQIHLFTKTTETTIPDGIYEFNTSEQPGTAYAGFRDDSEFYIGGSEFYFINRAYFNQSQLYPHAQWLIVSGTLKINGEKWRVDGHAMNGAEIHLTNSAEDQAVETVSGKKAPNEKYIENGKLVIKTQDGQMYDAIGNRIK